MSAGAVRFSWYLGTDQQSSMASAISSLIPPIEESVGAKLLKKMGWRPGQGVGPRISYDRLQRQDAQRTSSGFIPPTKGGPDEEAAKHTFAPRDTKVPLYRTKDDSFGLGYARAAGLASSSAAESSKKGPAISGTFFISMPLTYP